MFFAAFSRVTLHAPFLSEFDSCYDTSLTLVLQASAVAAELMNMSPRDALSDHSLSDLEDDDVKVLFQKPKPLSNGIAKMCSITMLLLLANTKPLFHPHFPGPPHPSIYLHVCEPISLSGICPRARIPQRYNP